jgi:hypothetical protein
MPALTRIVCAMTVSAGPHPIREFLLERGADLLVLHNAGPSARDGAPSRSHCCGAAR